MKKRERLFCHVLFYCSLLAIESAELLRGAIAELYRWLGTARMSSSSELPPVPLPVPVPFSGWLFFFSFFGLWFSAIYRMKHHFIFCYSSLGWLNAGRQSHFSSRLSSIALSSSSANHDDHSLIRVSCMRFRLKVYLFTSLPVYNLNNQLGKQNRWKSRPIKSASWITVLLLTKSHTHGLDYWVHSTEPSFPFHRIATAMIQSFRSWQIDSTIFQSGLTWEKQNQIVNYCRLTKIDD